MHLQIIEITDNTIMKYFHSLKVFDFDSLKLNHIYISYCDFSNNMVQTVTGSPKSKFIGEINNITGIT
jgi:hypothetical protein